MAYDLKTVNGYNMFDMSSMIQKAIRRCDIPHAAYAAAELAVKYRKYLWKRLLTVSAEDCWGIMTKEIVALEKADEIVNERNKPGQTNDLFIAKAIILLCMAKKNRDADYVACNFMWADKTMDDNDFDNCVDYEMVADLMKHSDTMSIPGYVYDCHTYKGKAMGKTQVDMFRDEQAALEPVQLSFFDNGSFGEVYERRKKKGKISYSEERKWQDFMRGKEVDPTHNGKIFQEDE